MILEILVGLLSLLIGYCVYLKKVKWTYFEKKGILQMPTSLPFGNFNEMIFQGAHSNDVVKNMYFKAEGHRFFGVYFLGNPALSIRDPELIRQILVKDFDHFVDRQKNIFAELSSSKTDKAWSRQLTSLNGDEWKDVRAAFSPIFTSGKMKAMMVFIRETSQRLTDEIAKHAKSHDDVELKDVFGKFSMDTIASCAFGVDAQSFTNSESQFVKNASAIFNRGFFDMIKFVFIVVPGLKELFKLGGFSIFKPVETQFFMNVITSTLRDRLTKGGSNRNDLIDMMLKAMKEDLEEEDSKEQFDVDSELKNHKGGKKKDIDELTIVATAMLMLIAGYDTTAQTLAYAGYELTKNPEVMKQLQDEVDAAYEEANGKTPDYSVIQNLPYLDMVIHETLRLHPPAGILMRHCTKDFQADGLELKKGSDINIPVTGIHMDPKYYPNPETFNPENFSKESRAKRSPYTFLGFGQGPRACLAMRFALLEAKVALMSVARQFDFKICAKTVDKIELDPKSALGGSKGGLWVRPEIRQL